MTEMERSDSKTVPNIESQSASSTGPSLHRSRAEESIMYSPVFGNEEEVLGSGAIEELLNKNDELPTMAESTGIRARSVDEEDKRMSVASVDKSSSHLSLTPPESPSFEQRLLRLTSPSSISPHSLALSFQFDADSVRAVKSPTLGLGHSFGEAGNAHEEETTPPTSPNPPLLPLPTISQTPPPPTKSKLLSFRRPSTAPLSDSRSLSASPTPSHHLALPSTPPLSHSRDVSPARSPQSSPSPSLGSTLLKIGTKEKEEKRGSTLLSFVGLAKKKKTSSSNNSASSSAPSPVTPNASGSGSAFSPLVSDESDGVLHIVESTNGNSTASSSPSSNVRLGGKAAALLGLGVGTTGDSGTSLPSKIKRAASTKRETKANRNDDVKELLPRFPCTRSDLSSIQISVGQVDKYNSSPSRAFLRKWIPTTLLLSSIPTQSTITLHIFPDHSTHYLLDREEERLELTRDSSVFVPDELHGAAYAMIVTGRGWSENGTKSDQTWTIGLDDVDSLRRWMGLIKENIIELKEGSEVELRISSPPLSHIPLVSPPMIAARPDGGTEYLDSSASSIKSHAYSAASSSSQARSTSPTSTSTTASSILPLSTEDHLTALSRSTSTRPPSSLVRPSTAPAALSLSSSRPSPLSLNNRVPARPPPPDVPLPHTPPYSATLSFFSSDVSAFPSPPNRGATRRLSHQSPSTPTERRLSSYSQGSSIGSIGSNRRYPAPTSPPPSAPLPALPITSPPVSPTNLSRGVRTRASQNELSSIIRPTPPPMMALPSLPIVSS